MHLFADGGDFGTLVLGSFLCVELATVFLNVQSWCETIRGNRDSALYRRLFAMTYISWLVSRLFVPLFCLIFWWWFVLLNDHVKDEAPLYCIIAYSICGHGIFVFCYVVFFFVLTPELVQILRGEDAATRAESKIKMRSQLASRAPSRIVSPNGHTKTEPFPGEDDAAAAAEDDINDPDTANIETAEAGGEMPAPLRPAEIPPLSTQTSIAELAEAAPSVRAALAAHGI